jgi:hypothetical protein
MFAPINASLGMILPQSFRFACKNVVFDKIIFVVYGAIS